jgi:hypothetical protein
VLKFRELFRANKTISLSENDPNVKDMFRFYCKDGGGNVSEKAVNQLKEMFIEQIYKNSQKSEILIREKDKRVRGKEILKERWFEKKMGLIGEKPPRNIDELKEEIKLWPRVGAKNHNQ